MDTKEQSFITKQKTETHYMDIEKADGKMRILYIHDEFTEEKDSDNEKSVTKKRAGGQRTKKPENSSLLWEDHRAAMKKDLLLEQLKYALQRDKELDSCLKAYLDAGGDNDNNCVVKARKRLEIQECKQKIGEAVCEENCKKLEQIIKEVKNKELYKELKGAIAAAQKSQKMHLRANKNPTAPVLSLNVKTITELRRYASAPATAHSVVRAVLLLLGENEDITQDWKECQRLCTPAGPQGLLRKILNLQVCDVHLEIASRANEIIEPLEFAVIKAETPTAAPLFIWVKDTLETIEQELEEWPEPAGIAKQHEIFGFVKESRQPKMTVYRKPKFLLDAEKNQFEIDELERASRRKQEIDNEQDNVVSKMESTNSDEVAESVDEEPANDILSC